MTLTSLCASMMEQRVEGSWWGWHEGVVGEGGRKEERRRSDSLVTPRLSSLPCHPVSSFPPALRPPRPQGAAPSSQSISGPLSPPQPFIRPARRHTTQPPAPSSRRRRLCGSIWSCQAIRRTRSAPSSHPASQHPQHRRIGGSLKAQNEGPALGYSRPSLHSEGHGHTQELLRWRRSFPWHCLLVSTSSSTS